MNTEDEVVVAHVERIGPAVYGPSVSCWMGGVSKRLKPVTSCWEFNVWLDSQSTRVFVCFKYRKPTCVNILKNGHFLM